MRITAKQQNAAIAVLADSGQMFEGADWWHCERLTRSILAAAFPRASLDDLPPQPVMTCTGLPVVGWMNFTGERTE